MTTNASTFAKLTSPEYRAARHRDVGNMVWHLDHVLRCIPSSSRWGITCPNVGTPVVAWALHYMHGMGYRHLRTVARWSHLDSVFANVMEDFDAIEAERTEVETRAAAMRYARWAVAEAARLLDACDAEVLEAGYLDAKWDIVRAMSALESARIALGNG